ncbi:MAG: hypothetical protein NTX95_02510 [Actinobacteria bacterium]|nr:hypothetical protein [Actinomycetota bacterium]
MGIFRRTPSTGGEDYEVGSKKPPSVSLGKMGYGEDASAWDWAFSDTMPYGIPEIYSEDQAIQRLAVAYAFAPMNSRQLVVMSASLGGPAVVQLPLNIGGLVEPLYKAIIESTEDSSGAPVPTLAFSTGHIQRALASGLRLAATFRHEPPKKTFALAELGIRTLPSSYSRDEATLMTALLAGHMSAVVPSEQGPLDLVAGAYGLRQEAKIGETDCGDLDPHDDSSFHWLKTQMIFVLAGKYIPHVAAMKEIKKIPLLRI